MVCIATTARPRESFHGKIRPDFGNTGRAARSGRRYGPIVFPPSTTEPSVPPPPACEPLPPRRFLGNRYVYCVLSQRAGGLSIGINLNPDQRCNFDCVYCEIDRSPHPRHRRLHIPRMIAELESMLDLVHSGHLEKLGYSVPAELLPFKEVALSGDGEPTLCPEFREAVEAIVHLRARHRFPFFKIVLITNTTGLSLPGVRKGIELLAAGDEIWAKLDAGTQEYMDIVNRPDISIEDVMENILSVARRRPVIIQSLIPLIDGREPLETEILELAARLRELRDAGAKIPLVQVYSAHRPAMDATCAHLPLRSLSRIAKTIRKVSGLAAEVF